MSVERVTPSVSGNLLFKREPGVGIGYAEFERDKTVNLIITGSQGVRFLSRLIEEATALRDELREVVG